MEKVLILTYYWPPSGGPGVQRWLKFAKYLPGFGYEPYIITVDPSQATYPVSDDSLSDEVSSGLKVFRTPTREPYAMYKKLSRQKQVPYSGFTNEVKGGIVSAITRFIRGNLFIPDARIGWNRFAIAQARKLIVEHNIKTIITTSPPHSTQLAGLKLKKEFPDITWIADLRDPWTDIFYYKKMLHLPFVKAKDLKLEKQVLQHADKVVTVSDYIKEIFRQKIDWDGAGKIEVITNGFDADDFQMPHGRTDSEVFTIAYTGTLADDYDLSGFLQVLGEIQLREGKKLRLRFVGNVSARWKESLMQQFGEIVRFDGHTEHKVAIELMQSADLLLLVIPDIAQNKGIVTGKIFEYMASCRQILGIGPPDGDAARILNETGSGTMFHYQDVEGMEGLIRKAMDKPDAWIFQKDAIDKYSRKQLTKRLTRLF